MQTLISVSSDDVKEMLSEKPFNAILTIFEEPATCVWVFKIAFFHICVIKFARFIFSRSTD